MLKFLLAIAAGGATLAATRHYAGKASHRQRHQAALRTGDRQRARNPQAVLNRQLVMISGGALIATASAVTSGGFGALALPFLWQPMRAHFAEGYTMLREQRRIGIALVDFATMAVFAALGYWVALTIAHALIILCKKMIVSAEDNSHRHLADVFDIGVSTVWVWQDGLEVETPFAELAQGDIVVIRAGEVIPADGQIVAGAGSVDQCALTGEAQPLEHQVGDTVMASSTLLTGQLRFRVERSGPETTAGRIAQALARSADYRLELQWRWSERLNQLAPLTLALGVSTCVLLGPFRAALMVLATSSLAYGMRVIAPLQLFAYLRMTSEALMLVKDGRVFEQLQDIDTVVFDKTGTLTQEQPHVEQIHCFADDDALTVLALAASAEQRQSHPIARAILAAAAARNLVVTVPQDGRYTLGLGISAQLDDGRVVGVGSTRYLASREITLDPAQQTLERDSHARGGNLVWVVLDDQLVGGIEIQPTPRPETVTVMQQLRAMGLHCCVLSGDRQAPTRYLAEHLGLDEWFAEVLPEGKAEVIRKLQAQGRRVCYVGDGINDSLALNQADVSVSLAGASSIAVDTAQVVMTDQGLSRLPLLLQSGRSFQRAMRRNTWLISSPVVLAIGGILMGTVGVGGVLVSYYAGVGLGAGQAMRKPRLEQHPRSLA